MNWMMKSTSLCLSISSVWVFVMRNEISYPWALLIWMVLSTAFPWKELIYLDRFPPQNEEALRSLCQESCEFVDQDVLDLVGLFYSDADSDGIDGRFY